MGSITSRPRRLLLTLSLALLRRPCSPRRPAQPGSAQKRGTGRSRPQSQPQTPPPRCWCTRPPRSFPPVDGRTVVWQDERSGPADIFFADLDTGAMRNLTNSPEWEAEPDISGALCRLARRLRRPRHPRPGYHHRRPIHCHSRAMPISRGRASAVPSSCGPATARAAATGISMATTLPPAAHLWSTPRPAAS